MFAAMLLVALGSRREPGALDDPREAHAAHNAKIGALLAHYKEKGGRLRSIPPEGSYREE